MTEAAEYWSSEAYHLLDELTIARAKIKDQERALIAADALAAAVRSGIAVRRMHYRSVGLMHSSLEDYLAAREDTL